MATMKRTKRAVVGAGLALGTLGIGGGAALVGSSTATAATTTPATAGAQANATRAQKVHKFLRRHTVHSTITVKTKSGYETIDLARGSITAISSGSITVQSADGTSLTATINDKTKFHNTTEQQLADGDKVGVLAYDGVARWVNAPKTSSSSTSS
jgi:hypothetical protein